MPRNSFIQMTKLHNVRGRIYYISSPKKQENLYAVYETTDRNFWTDLAKYNQAEFKKNGTEGKCIEARELIIALPESFTEYPPDRLLQIFTDHFRQTYGTDCIAALHHNKRKTNYHIHLIFSERTLLEQPIEKVATMQIKKERITDKIVESVWLYGNRPNLLSSIIGTAIAVLELLISKVFLKTLELADKVISKELEARPENTDFKEQKAVPEESRQIHQSLPYRQDHSHHRKQFLTSTYAKFIKSCKNRIKQFLHSRNSEVTLKLNCPTAKVSSKQKGVPNFQQR